MKIFKKINTLQQINFKKNDQIKAHSSKIKKHMN